MTLKLTAPEPLKIGHLLESFSSDEEALDLWLKNRAISN